MTRRELKALEHELRAVAANHAAPEDAKVAGRAFAARFAPGRDLALAASALLAEGRPVPPHTADELARLALEARAARAALLAAHPGAFE